jgi:hypothetical protein
MISISVPFFGAARAIRDRGHEPWLLATEGVL